MNGPTNTELEGFEEGELAGYIDSGIWLLEEFLHRPMKVREHFQMSFEDHIEE
jgi:hypothetical protein